MKGKTTVAITRQIERAATTMAASHAHRLRGLVSHLSRLEWWFVAALVVAYCFIMQPPGTNTISRWDMVWALAHGTTSIDAHAANTIDVSYFAGHYYSPRSLGPSALAVPVYWLVHGVAAILHRSVSMTFDLYAMNLLTTVPACIIAALLFARFVARLRPALAGTALPLVAASALALGTLYFPFSTEFFGHALGGSLAFIGFYLLYRARTSPRPRRLILAAGVLVGYAVISEYLLAAVALVLCGYVWATAPASASASASAPARTPAAAPALTPASAAALTPASASAPALTPAPAAAHERWRRLSWLALFVAGTLPSALLLAGYNWLAFGSPLHMSYGYVTGAKFAGQHSGLFGVTLPSLSGLVAIVAWPRGLLVESPFLLLVPLGLVRWWRAGGPRPSAEVVLSAIITVVYPLLVSSYFLPFAGENLPGPRLLVPMLPFACLALAWVVDAPRREGWGGSAGEGWREGWGWGGWWLRAVFAGLLAVGFALSALFVLLGTREYHTYLTYPVTDLFVPLLTTGMVPALNGPTPQSLGTKLLRLPGLASQIIYLVLFAAWCGYVLYALLRGASGALPHPSDAESLRTGDDGNGDSNGKSVEAAPVAGVARRVPGA